MSASADTARGSVLRTTALGVTVGVVVAVCAVLPAEFGIDPTGLGRAFGLMKLSEARPLDAAPVTPVGDGAVSGAVMNRTNRDLSLEPGQGVEFKVLMEEGAVASFRWIASGRVHFDHHGEPAGDTSGYFESYALGDGEALEGKFTALFTGTHGWYWRNDSDDPVEISVLVAGDFSIKTSL